MRKKIILVKGVNIGENVVIDEISMRILGLKIMYSESVYYMVRDNFGHL